MEIAIVGTKSLRIKSKNTSFIVNPEKKIDDPVVILTEKPESYEPFSDRLVIDGPGDYETAGVSIRSEKVDLGVSYQFLDEGQKLVVLSSAAAAKSIDMEDATAVAVFHDAAARESLSQITCDIVVAIGPEESLPQDKSNVKNADKINLKRAEEYKGFIVHLTK